MKVGNKVVWMTVNGPRTGIIEEIQPGGYALIHLPNGRYSLVHETGFSNGMEIHKRESTKGL